ncbi:hypothetical protein LDENG_00288120 [Lucifuga dentata]|nr:hypothetical protein LDENG_00288120 [Lucifuga dentata]
MSLGEQSQQWFPTSVRVTVHQARNLRIKGKNGTNDAYAIIQVAKDKFSTSVAEKCAAPVWKEEASFDLPLFHPSNAERCTLNIIVMHRAQVGLDKFLGQAVINLVDLHDNKSHNKTDWFKLMDKTGKEDKARGEVLLDIQFMRNNLSASMFDLSMQDKPRSRLSKLKDKVRGKKKDGFSDSASAIVPPVSQVLTDSEGEAETNSLNQFPGVKKKAKLKSLFVPKSNLQRNVSQSMSTLGALPEKNSSLSGSRSSGLNVDSPDVKKKFKFLGHKRTGSTDSKSSQGPFSLLGRSKQNASDVSNLCINGSHVYTEEAEQKSGSTLSLNSSGQGSVEDVHKHTSEVSADSLKGLPVISYSSEAPDRAILEQQRHQEDEERRRAEEKQMAEAKRLEEEEKRRAEAKRWQEEEEHKYQEEQERRRRFLEDDARKKRLREEEEEKKKEEERRRLEAIENQRFEEECQRLEEQQRQQEEAQKAEEQKKQEEASMSDRLSTLFGMIRRKEEKKEEVQQHGGTKYEQTTPAPRSDLGDHELHKSHHSTNPFVDIPLNSEPNVSSNESPADQQKSNRNPQTPSVMVFLNRTAKVSAVKPRLAESLKSEPTDCQSDSQQCPSPATSESTLSNVSSESPVSFSNLHSSLAPPSLKHLSECPCGSLENLSSVGSSPTMSENRRRAPLPPSYPAHVNQTGLSAQTEQTSRSSSALGNHVAVRETKNLGYTEVDGLHCGKRPSVPLPDYESLFPEKRHGVHGHTRWDHIVAEVTQRHRDQPSDFVGQEMSVDGPQEHVPSLRSSLPQESSSNHYHHTQAQEAKPVSSKKDLAPLPPKPVASTPSKPVADFSVKQSQSTAQTRSSLARLNPSPVPGSRNSDTLRKEILASMASRDETMKPLHPSPTAAHVSRPNSQLGWKTRPSDDQREVLAAEAKDVPMAKPRTRPSGKDSVMQEDSAVTPVASGKNINHAIQTSSISAVNKDMDNKSRQAKENFAEFDPFPITDLLSKDPWAQLEKNQPDNDIFTRSMPKEMKLKDQGMTEDDFDQLFAQEKPANLASVSLEKDSELRPKDNLSEQSPAVQRSNSQRRKQIITSVNHPDNRDSKPQKESTLEEETTVNIANQGTSVKEVNKSQPQADVKTQSNFYVGEDPFGTGPFAVPSMLSSISTFSEPLPVILEEPASQAAGLSGGKTPLRAWVSPSEIQSVSGNGGGLVSVPRRPHPVKPMNNTAESQHPTSTPAVKEIKSHDNTTKIKVADSVVSGPYTQLTQEELITLVVKQQSDLSRKDAKIEELEQYIDNLLVRVIDEKPSILQALDTTKPM